MKENILLPALNKNYAVGAFNFCNMEVLRAIVNAANEAKSPVIAQISKGAIEYATPEYLKGIIAAARKRCAGRDQRRNHPRTRYRGRRV